MINQQLFDFIKNSPTCYHTVRSVQKELEACGFESLQESRTWTLKEGGKYFVTRNRSSLAAFQIPPNTDGSFHIAAAHTDSPAFKLKEGAEITTEKNYVKLNTEKYGGMNMSGWLDRPLSIAGRVLAEKDSSISTILVDFAPKMVLIPSLAIHMNREVNTGFKYNPQTDLLPLLGDDRAEGALSALLAEAAGVEESQIYGSDLFLYDPMEGRCWGPHQEYISCPRLDDLQGVFTCMKGFLSAGDFTSIPLLCILDNEEVGSQTKQGAASTFLADIMSRILTCLGRTSQSQHEAFAKTFMLSVDNAHAVHPNHPEKSDPTSRPYMNQGVVIKYNANQKYTTDAVSASIFKKICKQNDIPYQSFLNRSDMPGGSTLGNISNTQVSVNTIDIGVAQLSMHAPYETAGAWDTDCLIRAVRAFYQSRIQIAEDGIYEVS